MEFRLRFKPNQIDYWAGRYAYPSEGDMLACIPRVRAARFLTKQDLLEIGTWKSPRIRPRLASNDDGLVREVTRIALSTSEERLRLHVLLALQGVGWPVASVILHLCHADRYPILDFRALWSVSAKPPSVYTYEFWAEYTAICRQVSADAGVSMRQLDRALWQYSKEKQPRA